MQQGGCGELSRRAFIGVSAAGAVHLAARAAEPPAVSANQQEKNVMAACRYWIHGFGGDDPKATAKAMREAGFNVVVAGGEAVIAAVRAEGMVAWQCGGAFGVGADDEALKAVDIRGNRQVWFGSGCPNQPALRERNMTSYETMTKTAGLEGILVDGCRFASPASGLNPYFTCFCDVCREKAGRLGFDFEAIKRDVQALYDLVSGKGAASPQAAAWLQNPIGLLEWLTARPGVLEWLRFRRVCVTEHFRALSGVIHGANLKMGVYIFTPSVAPLVGQSYVDLAEFMDVFAPMIYRNYPDRPGEACLNWELTILPEELGLAESPVEAQAMTLILSWAGLAAAVPARTIKDIRAALPPAAVGHETAMARAQIGPRKELAPIIYIDDPLMAQTADLVRKNGANGVNFFVYKDNWADLTRPGIVKG
jgi:hypothetical protein